MICDCLGFSEATFRVVSNCYDFLEINDFNRFCRKWNIINHPPLEGFDTSLIAIDFSESRYLRVHKICSDIESHEDLIFHFISS